MSKIQTTQKETKVLIFMRVFIDLSHVQCVNASKLNLIIEIHTLHYV